MADQTRTAVDWLINVALIGAVIYGSTAMRAPKAAAELPPYINGEFVPTIEGVSYSKPKATLVIFLRSSCVYCELSLPFYSRLVAERNRLAAPLQIVAVTLEDKDVIDSFLSDHNVTVDATATIARAAWRKLARTPTLLLVDKDGRVRDSWVGRLSSDGEQLVQQSARELWSSGS